MIQKSLKSQKMGKNGIGLNLKAFDLELGKEYQITKKGDEIVIKKVIEEKTNANL